MRGCESGGGENSNEPMRSVKATGGFSGKNFLHEIVTLE